MEGKRARSLVFWLKLAAVSACAFAALWFAFYVTRRFADSVEIEAEGAGAFAAALAGGLAVAAVVAVFIVVCIAALVSGACAGAFVGLERKFSALRGEGGGRKRHLVFRVLSDVFALAAAAVLFALSLSVGAMGLVSALAAAAGAALCVAAEIVQGRALRARENAMGESMEK